MTPERKPFYGGTYFPARDELAKITNQSAPTENIDTEISLTAYFIDVKTGESLGSMEISVNQNADSKKKSEINNIIPK